MGKRLLFVFLPLLAGLCTGEAVAEERPKVASAEVFVTDGGVVAQVTVRDLFSERIVGTVQSGLPAVVELMFKLTEGKRRTVNQGLISYELSYDVWDDRYAIATADSTRAFPSFDEMKNAIHSLLIRIAAPGSLSADAEYSAMFAVAVYPLRGKEQQQIQGWVSDAVRGGAPGDQRQQLLNLNELIEHFFARNQDATRSEWYHTVGFRLSDLPKRGDE